jgi:hypothetical protein
MNALLFILIWKYYSRTYLDNDSIPILWEKDTIWTKHILYGEGDNKKYLLQNTFYKYGFSNTVFEYRKIDFTVFSSKTYVDINNYDNTGVLDNTIPTAIDAILEVENDYRKCFEEIRKLCEIKAKLKVLITYPPDNSSRTAIIEKMRKGITQSNDYFHENINTEYLLIFGKISQNSILWDYLIFNTEGIIINN